MADSGKATALVKKATELHVVIATGDRAVYDSFADRVTVPGGEGQLTILLHHAALLAALDPGELVVHAGPKEESFAIGGGFIEVRDDQVIILADTAERSEEIDLARAEAARNRATALMKAYRGRPEFVVAAQALRRSRARIKVAHRALAHSSSGSAG